MSTLTKILIVLLTIASIFLCGIVATYVATAENYKQKYKDTRGDMLAAVERQEAQKKELEEYKKKAERREDELEAQISSIDERLKQKEAELANSERLRAELEKRVSEWAAVTRDFSQTNSQQRAMLAEAQAQSKELEAEKINLDKKLKDMTAYLETRLAIIEDLEAQVKQLREEKVELQDMLAERLMPSGKAPGEVETVTREVSRVRAGFEAPKVRDIQLTGRISDLRLSESMAEISLGTADGVRDGMRFYVTREDEFVCELLVIDVDSEKSIAIIERKRLTPEKGDKISTNL